MLQFARGDAEAFDELYSRYKDAVYRYCLRQLPPALAEEAHQEAWLAVIKARGRYEARSQFKGWLFTLAHNAVQTRIRVEMKHPDSSDPESVPSAETPENSIDRQSLTAMLVALIHALPNHQRDALLLQQEGGFSIEEIAEITRSSHEGVKSRLRYAMGKLREQMASYTLPEL